MVSLVGGTAAASRRVDLFMLDGGCGGWFEVVGASAAFVEAAAALGTGLGVGWGGRRLQRPRGDRDGIVGSRDHGCELFAARFVSKLQVLT